VWLIAAVLVAGAVHAGPVHADTVHLKSGKKLENVTVSRDDGEVVVINPWNSRHPDMTWEIPDKSRIPRDKVESVEIKDAPLVEYRRRSVAPGASADDLFALAEFCAEHKFKKERERELRRALSLDPAHAGALAAFGGASKWERASKGDADAIAELRDLEREYVQLTDPEQLAAQRARLKDARSTRPLVYLERARRSAQQQKGTREKVPLTFRSETAPGATYCIHVPRDYDPLVPTALVIGLHGGGPDGADGTLVTGSGEAAMPFYVAESERWNWIVVCPTALRAYWNNRMNDPWIDALLEEMRLLYNIDENRIYLTGHSMGGFGTWHWGPKLADVWAAISPCAGGQGPNGVAGTGLPVYIFHGTDDGVVPVGGDRSAAKSLAGGNKPYDFVYTELDGVGHGFPQWVREDIFRFFAGRWKDDGRKRSFAPRSTFERKVSKEEKKTFGDPSSIPSAAAGGDTKTKDLLAAVQKGGGGGKAAAEALGALKEPKVAKSVSKLLRARETSVDTRVLCCTALGLIGLPECIKPLEGALGDDDYRVVEVAVAGLGANASPDAAAPLARGVAKLGEWFEKSINGNKINFTEYEIRLGSLGLALDACAKRGEVDLLLPEVDKAVVRPVFARDKPLVVRGEDDERFKDNPSRARMLLGRRLIACLEAWGDRRGKPLVETVRDAWKDRQPRLAAEMDAALSD
jgi:poly(3-hydroxybutyrate) depolymerase